MWKLIKFINVNKYKIFRGICVQCIYGPKRRATTITWPTHSNNDLFFLFFTQKKTEHKIMRKKWNYFIDKICTHIKTIGEKGAEITYKNTDMRKISIKMLIGWDYETKASISAVAVAAVARAAALTTATIYKRIIMIIIHIYAARSLARDM